MGRGRVPRRSARLVPSGPRVGRLATAFGVGLGALGLAACGSARTHVAAGRAAENRPHRVASARARTTRPRAVGSRSRAVTAQTPSGTSRTALPPLTASLAAWLRAHTTASVVLPSALPPGLSATVRVTSEGWAVGLFRCPSQLPLNSAGIGTGACGAMDNVFGDVRLERTGSPSAAHAALDAAVDLAAVRPCLDGETAAKVALGSGQVGSVRRADVPGATTSACVLAWSHGAWRIFLSGNPSTTALEAAGRPLASALVSHPLPEGGGIVAVDVAPDGDHTTIAWNEGDDVVVVSTREDPVEAVAVAASLRPVSSAGSEGTGS